MMSALKELDPNIVLLAAVGLLAVLVIAALGRRLSVTVGNVHAELTPNGGSSVRDAIDRIERKADKAVVRAEDAALHAHSAAQHAASALSRIEALEAAPTASASVIVTSAPEPAG
jgi:sulfur carrier protein ThiS